LKLVVNCRLSNFNQNAAPPILGDTELDSMPSLITWPTLILLLAAALEVARPDSRRHLEPGQWRQRFFRVLMNTPEHTVAFLPALWLAAWYWSPAWGLGNADRNQPTLDADGGRRDRAGRGCGPVHRAARVPPRRS
jgi:hypothetical protein